MKMLNGGHLSHWNISCTSDSLRFSIDHRKAATLFEMPCIRYVCSFFPCCCVVVCVVCCAFFSTIHSLSLSPLLSVVFRFYTPIDNIHFGKKRERFNIDLIDTTHFELISFALLLSFSFRRYMNFFFLSAHSALPPFSHSVRYLSISRILLYLLNCRARINTYKKIPFLFLVWLATQSSFQLSEKWYFVCIDIQLQVLPNSFWCHSIVFLSWLSGVRSSLISTADGVLFSLQFNAIDNGDTNNEIVNWKKKRVKRKGMNVSILIRACQ